MITRRGFMESAPLVYAAFRGFRLAAGPASNEKFTPIDLARYATDGVAQVDVTATGWFAGNSDRLSELPGGPTLYAGIPFLRTAREARRRIIVLGKARPVISIDIARKCHYVCFAHFCDRHPEDTAGPFGLENPRSHFEPIGQLLATYTLIFEDGSRHDQPIRRRYEVNPPGTDPSHVPAAAQPSFEADFLRLDAPLTSYHEWTESQTGISKRVPADHGPILWIYALRNPIPEKTVARLELKPAGEDLIGISGLTLFHAPDHPLRREPLRRYEIRLPEPEEEWTKKWELSVDLGKVAAVSPVPDFQPDRWLRDPYAGLGEPAPARRAIQRLVAEIIACPAATLCLKNRMTGQQYSYNLREPGAPVRVIDPETTWVHAQVVDEATGKPIASRISFRDALGRYLAPYGHAQEVSTGWLQNLGPDVKIGGASYAFVDGSFQIELPPGEVYVEISKGFEYRPVRRRVRIEAGQKELRQGLVREFRHDAEGWVTADTHVHAGSPSLLVLEGAAEGLNLVNLLAAQWGRYFTNFADPPGRFEGSTPETTVWVGSENRQNFLGHIGLLGLRERVIPFSDAGPPVAYFGAPLTTTLAEWADQCRAQGGLTVGMHFPIPNGETAVDVVLGKLDGAEIRYDGGFASLGVTEYYRYLNCGYRLAAVGGTDKMAPIRAVGAIRTYARLERDQAFSFDNWSKAVRAGRTFVTTGPALFLKLDGQEPGATLEIGNGRQAEVELRVDSVFPVGTVEVVYNGRVVVAGQNPLREKVQLTEPGWLAARCSAPERLSYGMKNIGAHTSPIYLTRQGRSGFSVETAQYLMKLIEGAILWVDTIATPGGREQMEKIGRLFQDASFQLSTRMGEHRHR